MTRSGPIKRDPDYQWSRSPFPRPTPGEIIARAKELGLRLAPGSTLPLQGDRGRRKAGEMVAAKDEAFEASGGQCVWPGCHRRAVDPHHVKSAGQGGPNEAENVAPLCRPHHIECVNNRPLAESLGLVKSGHVFITPTTTREIGAGA